MAKQNTAYRTAFDKYVSLLQQGVPTQEAYRQAFPQGMETGQPTPEQQAKKQQQQGLVQIGGALAGALGTKAVFDAMEGKRVLGGLRDTVSGYFNGAPAAEAGAGAVATPQVTSITRGPVMELPAGSTTTPDGKVVDQTGNVVGNWVQGALGAIQVYQGVKQYQEGQKLEGALGASTGALNVASALGSQTAAQYVPYANIAMGTYGLGQMALKGGEYSQSQKGQLAAQGAMSGAQVGAGIGSFLPGVGTAIGAGIGAAIGGTYGLVAGLSGSGKGVRQMVRDKWRDSLLENNVGLFDEKYQGKLPDGSTFDWGKDKFAFGKGEGRIDLENPVVGKAAAYGNVLAALQGATDTKPREAIATQFLAAGTQNAADDMNKMKGNFQYFFNQLGMKQADAQAQLDTMFNEGKLDEEKYKIFSNDLREMLG
jgi:hypothetical protein